MCLSLGSIRATVDSEPVEYRRNHRSGIRRISSIPSTGGCAHVSFKFDQLKLSGIRECREAGDSENRACEISLARLSQSSVTAPGMGRRRDLPGAFEGYLASLPPVLGLGFGAFGEWSAGVSTLIGHLAEIASEVPERLGC